MPDNATTEPHDSWDDFDEEPHSWVVCDECGGSGICPDCKGEGDGINFDCRWCDNSEVCPECNGEGGYDPHGE